MTSLPRAGMLLGSSSREATAPAAPSPGSRPTALATPPQEAKRVG